MLHLVGCLYYLYQWCTVKQISDNEIYLLIKYIKSVFWRVAKCLSYIEEARCLKVKTKTYRISTNKNHTVTYVSIRIRMSVFTEKNKWEYSASSASSQCIDWYIINAIKISENNWKKWLWVIYCNKAALLGFIELSYRWQNVRDVSFCYATGYNFRQNSVVPTL